MASFLNKINRIRNVRMHMANEFIYPDSAIYHEIIQGIPWTGGYSRSRPKTINVPVDRLVGYVIKQRPEYKNYAWCPPDNGGVYVHPAMWTSDRMQHHLDNNPHLNVREAFEMADKEMDEKKARLDLQVTLAREHAARLGVTNRGVEGFLMRANKVYESVYEMKYEEAEQSRRAYLEELCREISVQGQRLDMQDIIDCMPIKDEQIQFFKDFPEYRKLFPPLWYVAEEVVQAQALETRRRVGDEGEYENDENEFIPVEEDPNGTGPDQWPPKHMFDRQNRNKQSLEFKKKSGVNKEDAELLIAKQEALKYLTEEYRNAQESKSTIAYEPEEGEAAPVKQPISVDENTAQSLLQKAEALGEKIFREGEEQGDAPDFLKSVINKHPNDVATTLQQENAEFYNSYRSFIQKNVDFTARDRPKFGTFFAGDNNNAENSEYQNVLREREQGQTEQLRNVMSKYLVDSKTGKPLDFVNSETIANMREEVRDKLGAHVEDVTFAISNDGGAVNPRQFAGVSTFDELAPRHVNLVSDLELTPFYPENAFPPQGVVADPTLDFEEASILPENKEQLDALKAFGAKYAHAIEDHAPVKSQAYIEESLKWGTPIVTEGIPKLETSLEAQAEELLSLKDKFAGKGEPKSLAEFKEKGAAVSEKPDVSGITSEDELKAIKQQMLDELASKAFESEEERKEYETMLERRFDYLVAKKRELYEQWAQYWPSDKPEALIYRGPEVIREIFPEAYRLAVTRQFEDLTGLPLKQALGSKSYGGLWSSVRHRENNTKPIRDLEEFEWQNTVSLDPANYKQ